MAFIFKFTTLLNLSIHEEGEVKIRLARIDGVIAENRNKIEILNTRMDTAIHERTIDLEAGNMDKIRMYPAYFRRLQNEREFHEEELERLFRQREKVLAELQEKRRIRKTYEKIREHDEKEYVKQLRKREQKALDEFASRSRPVNHDIEIADNSQSDQDEPSDFREVFRNA